MDKSLLFFLFSILLTCGSLYGQDESSDPNQDLSAQPNHDLGITIKALALDYISQNGGSFSDFKSYHIGFEIGVMKRLMDKLYLHVPLKAGVVQHPSGVDAEHHGFLSIDARGQYHFLDHDNPIVPFALAGIGYVYERNGIDNDGVSHLQIPVGAGVNFRLANRAYLTFQSEYRLALEDDRNNLHHGLGFTYFFGPKEEPKPEEETKKEVTEEEVSEEEVSEEKEEMDKDEEMEDKLDSDGDGLIDELDLCPQEAGIEELDGCPDKDGDGVADYKDACPDQFGAIANNGCPDSDGDGVPDNEDECPNMAGSVANNGCPDNDADQDGIPNDVDRCPTVAGPASNGGCPEVDTDGDGTPDSIDECPNAIGPKNTLGCPDQDGDGTKDALDRCPSVPGSPANNGCPDEAQDTDGDGIPDNVDKCPLRAGSSLYAGCPDTDGDGVDDSRDACPNEPGPAATRGCPRGTTPEPEDLRNVDSDGDGVMDADDKCPGRPGPAVYDGCPDTDGDGLDDSRDRCPNSAGPVDTQGCPEVTASDRRILQIAMRSVQFETGKAEIKAESFRILRQIAEIMDRYPDFNLSIEGHTDSQGSAIDNQRLSENRAQACYNFLSNTGVPVDRMSFAGYGESRPIANNQTISGRTLNRRVEFALVPRL